MEVSLKLAPGFINIGLLFPKSKYIFKVIYITD